MAGLRRGLELDAVMPRGKVSAPTDGAVLNLGGRERENGRIYFWSGRRMRSCEDRVGVLGRVGCADVWSDRLCCPSSLRRQEIRRRVDPASPQI